MFTRTINKWIVNNKPPRCLYSFVVIFIYRRRVCFFCYTHVTCSDKMYLSFEGVSMDLFKLVSTYIMFACLLASINSQVVKSASR